MFLEWLSRIWKGSGHRHRATPIPPRDKDADLAELAALIESDDISEAKLERMADLIGQSDPNRERF